MMSVPQPFFGFQGRRCPRHLKEGQCPTGSLGTGDTVNHGLGDIKTGLLGTATHGRDGKVRNGRENGTKK